MRNPMPEQPADVRNHNFEEVALGYPEDVAVDEAQRCLNCKNPQCVKERGYPPVHPCGDGTGF